MTKPNEIQRHETENTPANSATQDQLPPSPWQARGVDDVYFQRDAQVTWWTILGGIAVGALLTQLPDVISQTQSGRWWLVLYFLA
jgi:hypothetical protein